MVCICLRVSGSNDGLGVTVGDGFCKSLTCEIGVEVRNWHLVMVGPLKNWRGDCVPEEWSAIG